jgi:flagellar hook-associated protein 1 FlgK
VAISTLSGSVGGTNLSAYFGINALLVGGTSSETIAVNPALVASASSLATGVLADPTTSTSAVASGDGTIATQLANALNDTQNLSAAGFLGASTETFTDYAADMISDVATRYQTAQSTQTTADSTLTQLQTSFGDQSGVNVDNESAKITALEDLYDASSQVISTVRSMFQSLLTAVQSST